MAKSRVRLGGVRPIGERQVPVLPEAAGSLHSWEPPLHLAPLLAGKQLEGRRVPVVQEQAGKFLRERVNTNLSFQLEVGRRRCLLPHADRLQWPRVEQAQVKRAEEAEKLQAHQALESYPKSEGSRPTSARCENYPFA